MPRAGRTVVYLVLLILLVVWTAVRLGQPPPSADEAARDVTVAQMDETLASLRASITADPATVIVLGDSSFLDHWVLAPEDTLAYLLEHDAKAAGLSVRVVAHNGFDPIAYYLLADAVAALRPRAVVVTANLQAFTDAWFRRPRMKHPQLAAYVRPSRVTDAMALPLDLAGITDTSLAVYPVLRAFGLSTMPEALEGYRERFRAALDGAPRAGAKAAAAAVTVGTAFAAAGDVAAPVASGNVAAPVEAVPPPAPAVLPTPRGHRAAPGARGGAAKPQGAGRGGNALRRFDLYPSHLAREQANVRVLEATLRDLAARDVRTVVLLPPVHVQALRLTGMYAIRDLPGAVTLLGDVARDNGATPIDLTEMLPQETYFTDAFTHFTPEGNRMVTAAILAELRRILAGG